MRRALPFALLALLFACEDEPPPLVLPPPPPPPPRVIVASPRAVAGPGAFDLVITDDGPLLIFGPPSADGGGIRLLSLGPSGQAEGGERVLIGGSNTARELAPQSDEIVAAAGGGRVRIAWVERDQLVFTVRSMMIDGAGGAPGAVEDLGRTTRTVTGRGSLAMAAHGGEFDLLHRREDGPCNQAQVPSAAGRCARFSTHRAGGQRTGRRGGGLAIPHPCDRPVLGFQTVGGVWYQALCAVEEGQTGATVFALQFEPEYAHAEPVLQGCTPRTLSAAGSGVALTSDCEGGRGVWITDAGREVRRLEGNPTLSCENDLPVWVYGDQRIALSEPRNRVEGLMRSTDISEHARAAWTGTAVLVAESVGDELSIRRFECDEGRFRRTDHEAL